MSEPANPTFEHSGYLQTSEVARRCGVSASTVLMWERLGRLRAIRTSRGIRLYDPREVDAFADERRRAHDGAGAA